MRRSQWRGRIGRTGLGLAMLAMTAAAPAPAPIELPADQFFPESITAGPDGMLYVGSVNGGMWRARPGAARADQWIAPGTYGSRSVFGVLADARSNTLWLCSNDLSGMGHAGPAGGAAGSWLMGFDLKSGAGKTKAAFPAGNNWCNDIAVAKDGTLYVTNMMTPQILRLRPGAQALEVWLTDPRFQAEQGPGLDGIAIGGDGNLYVTTLRGGGNALFRIAVAKGAAGAVTELQTSRPLQDPDGLRSLRGNSFALAEAGGRIDRVTVKGDRAEIETLKEGLTGPTSVVPVGGTGWYVEGQLDYFFKNQPAPVPFRISPVPIAK